MLKTFSERFGRMFWRFGSQVSGTPRGISLQFRDPTKPGNYVLFYENSFKSA